MTHTEETTEFTSTTGSAQPTQATPDGVAPTDAAATDALTEEEARAVLRQRALRRLWPFSRPGRGRREEQAARRRLG